MKKRLALSLFFFLLFCIGICQQQPSCLRISAHQKTKSGSIPLSGALIEVVINDSMHFNHPTNEEGRIQQIDLPPGKYKISAKYSDCNVIVANDVEVRPESPTYYTFSFLCPSFIKSLSKKEKKKLGIKP